MNTYEECVSYIYPHIFTIGDFLNLEIGKEKKFYIFNENTSRSADIFFTDYSRWGRWYSPKEVLEKSKKLILYRKEGEWYLECGGALCSPDVYSDPWEVNERYEEIILQIQAERVSTGTKPWIDVFENRAALELNEKGVTYGDIREMDAETPLGWRGGFLLPEEKINLLPEIYCE